MWQGKSTEPLEREQESRHGIREKAGKEKSKVRGGKKTSSGSVSEADYSGVDAIIRKRKRVY